MQYEPRETLSLYEGGVNENISRAYIAVHNSAGVERLLVRYPTSGQHKFNTRIGDGVRTKDAIVENLQ